MDKRRRWHVLLVVGLLLGAGVVIAANDFAPGEAGKINGGVPFTAPDGLTVTVTGETNMSMDDVFRDNDTVVVNVTEGNISMAAAGDTAATVHPNNMTGTWTNVTNITAGGTWIEVYPEDKQRVDVRGDTTDLSIRSMTLDDGTVDFYINGTDGGLGTVKAYDLPANRQIVAMDADTNTFLDVDTSTATGNATFDIDLSSHAVELQSKNASVAPTFANPEPDGDTIRWSNETVHLDVLDGDFPQDEVEATVFVDGVQENQTTLLSNGTVQATVTGLSEGTHNYSVQAEDAFGNINSSQTYEFTVEHYEPTLSDPNPTGEVTSQPSEINITVNDGDFPLDGDTVTVNITLDGTRIHSEDITSNSTVSTSNYSSLDLGGHTWQVNASDTYGNWANNSYAFSLPSNITLRNETNASQVITDQNITATFYSANGEIVVQRSDSDEDGNISLAGLPDTAFVVTFSGDGWYDRRIYLDTIFDQSNIYLLNSTAYPDAIATTFLYEDRTNQFDQDDTTLQIERAVDPNNDDEFEWQVIAGDFWGAAGEFPFTGQYQSRYRLRITNQETGDSRLLGTHIPREDGVKNIVVGDIIFEAENATGRYWDAGINNNTSNLQVLYQDPTNGTTDLEIVVYEQGNQSNELYNNTFAGPLGREVVSIPLTGNQSDTNWIVTFDGTHDSDGAVVGQLIVGGSQYDIPIGPEILASFVYVLITGIMALYGPRTALAGAWAGVGVLGLVMVMGWAQIPVATITVAVLIAAGGTLYREAMPT